MGHTHSIYHFENLIYETLWIFIHLSAMESGRVILMKSGILEGGILALGWGPTP